MAYTKQTWADLPSKTTPINAERLTHIEDGIFNAAQTADTAASTAGTAAANVGIVSGRVETLTGRVNDLDTAVSNKVDKVAGKGLSTNDYDNTDKGKVDSLGTASTKNSTSVVTESSDLVESGAVKELVGWGNANIADNYIDTSTVLAGVTLALNSDKTITLSGTSTSAGSRNCCEFLGSYLKSKGDTLYVSGGVANKAYIALRNDGFSYAKVSRGDTVAVDTSELLDDATYYISLGIEASGIDETGVVIKPTLSKEKSGSYEPYHASVEDSLEDKMSYADNGVLGAKNLFNIPKTGYKNPSTLNVTTVINDDGSVVVNGQVTNVINFFSFVRRGVDGFILPPNTKYIVSIGNSNNAVDINIGYTHPTSGSYVNFATSAKGATELEFTTPAESEGMPWTVQLEATLNTSFSNYKIYPMFRLASDTDPTFAPYSKTNIQLTKDKADNSVIGTVEGANASKAWSVGEHFISGGQFKEVTQPIASGGAISDSNTVNKPIADCLVKQATFSGTTNVSGNFSITTDLTRVVLGIELNNDQTALKYKTSSYIGIHIMNASTLEAYAEQFISGTYYYI